VPLRSRVLIAAVVAVPLALVTACSGSGTPVSPGTPSGQGGSIPSGPASGPQSLSEAVPARLRVLMIGLLVASLAWGAVTAWTVIQHSSAAHDVVSTSEPLSLSAQRMYLSLSDADVTATTAFLAGVNVPLPERQRYAAGCAWGLARRIAEYQ
jgi:hypothetical protein